MNKLLQNRKIWCHVKLAPLFDIEFKNEEEELNYVESVWNHLENDSLTRNAYHARRAKLTISVWSDDKYTYLVEVIRTEYNTNNALVYMAPLSDSQIDDFKAIAKMLHRDLDTMGKDYKQLLIDAKLSTYKPKPEADA